MTKVRMALLLDESGSMNGRQQGVIDGVNEFVGALRDEQAEDEVRVSLQMFDANGLGQDDRVRVKWDDKALVDVPALAPGDYAPRGMTPLNDAVIETIERVSRQMTDGDRAMLVVYTDGLENASEATADAVKRLVEAKEKDGWAFIYLGAKQDEWAKQDANVGMAAAGQTFTTTTTNKGTRSSLSTAGQMASAYATMDAADYKAMAASRPKDIAEDEHEHKPKSRGSDGIPNAKRPSSSESLSTARKTIRGS